MFLEIMEKKIVAESENPPLPPFGGFYCCLSFFESELFEIFSKWGKIVYLCGIFIVRPSFRASSILSCLFGFVRYGVLKINLMLTREY